MQQAKPIESKTRFYKSGIAWANFTGILVVLVDLISSVEFLALLDWPAELLTLLGWLPDTARGPIIAILIMAAFVYNLYNSRESIQWIK